MIYVGWQALNRCSLSACQCVGVVLILVVCWRPKVPTNALGFCVLPEVETRQERGEIVDTIRASIRSFRGAMSDVPRTAVAPARGRCSRSDVLAL